MSSTGDELGPASRKMCAECPWASVNQGRPHPHDWYGRDQTLAHWRWLRSGAVQSCHVTEADREVYAYDDDAAAAGFVQPRENARRRECAGAAVALLRELRRCTEAGSYDAYRAAWPAGLEAAAVEGAAARLSGLAGPRLHASAVGEAGVVDVPTWPGLDLLDFATTGELRALADALGALMASPSDRG